ncbi:MAG: GxxExxY protein [Vicinamibacterales bacterium]
MRVSQGVKMRRQVQVPLPIVYESVRLDVSYRLDLLVEEQVIVEVKAVTLMGRDLSSDWSVSSGMNPSTRHFMWDRIRLLVPVGLCSLALACRTESIAGDDLLTDASGVPGEIVYVTNSIAGGQRMLDSMQLDSARGRWSQSQCGPVSATSGVCDGSSMRTDIRTVESFMRVPVFERARRADFRAVHREYHRTGSVPPDVTTHVLHIVQNGRRRTVSWESGAVLPSAVDAFLCRLQQAQGALILCSE